MLVKVQGQNKFLDTAQFPELYISERNEKYVVFAYDIQLVNGRTLGVYKNIETAICVFNLLCESEQKGIEKFIMPEDWSGQYD